MAEKTAAGLVAWCKENLGMPYWYCSQGQRLTAAWLKEKIRQCPKKWTQARIAKARGEVGKFPRCFDCVGLIKGYLWAQPGGGMKYIAAQDKTADGLRAVSNPRPISTLPELPGVLVFCPGHVGVYIGNGRVIESYGFQCVADRPISAQKWECWGRCPYIRYPDTAAAPPQKPPADAPGYILHTMKPGDTLWALARRYLGPDADWRVIAKLNNIADERKIPDGKVIKIPRKRG